MQDLGDRTSVVELAGHHNGREHSPFLFRLVSREQRRIGGQWPGCILNRVGIELDMAVITVIDCLGHVAIPGELGTPFV